MDILEYSSGQYWQAFTRKSNKPCRFKTFKNIQGVHKPWIFLEFLESARVLGFSGKSLLKERIAEIILEKCEFKKIYHIFLKSHSQ